MVYLETKEGAKAFLASLASKHLILHNAIFDCAMIESNFGVSLIDSVHTDTMILGHVLDENRSNALKELGVSIFGEDSRKEQSEMKASVTANGGVLTKDKYELFKADAELIGRYGAKDAVLTLKLFYHLVPELYEQQLDKFFYEDESMPLLRGPTYQLNTTGLKVDSEKLQQLRGSLEVECEETKAYVYKEVDADIKPEYSGKSKATIFNIGSSKHLSWLLFIKLGNPFNRLTESGREVCKFLGLRLPYSYAQKRDFVQTCTENKGRVYEPSSFNYKTGKTSRPKKIADVWHYLACGKDSLKMLSNKYRWVQKLLDYSKALKILNTYVVGIQNKMQYGIIRPSFLQHGTTSGRYSSRHPNFQNLPRDDKRVKACIVSRPGKVFVGADYSQLEPRVFASLSKDERLLNCFKSDEDFYSVIGMEVFDKYDCTPMKDGSDKAFGTKYKSLRDISKVIALSATYGTTAPKMAPTIGKTIEEAQEVINDYFEKFPSVKAMMLESHEQAKRNGRVLNLYGRPRRMPKARAINDLFPNVPHGELEYEYRNLLNLSVNHRVQSTAASIMNRAAIAVWRRCRELGWKEVTIVLQVHDELILEGPENLAELMVDVLKEAMEHTVELPGVELIAEPKIAHNLADLK